MKKRDLYWVNLIVIFLLVTIFFAIMTVFNILQFNTSYIQEEKEELQIYKKQIEWAIKPILEQKNNILLQKYCDDFEKEDVEFRIFDKNKKLLASSNKENKSNLMNKNSQILNHKFSKLKLYMYSTRDKKIEVFVQSNDLLSNLLTSNVLFTIMIT